MPNKGDINPATGKAYAVNPSTGNWDDNYWANVVEPQLRGTSGGGSSSGGNVASSAADLLKMYQEANKPAIASLEASKPEMAQKYEQTGQYLQKQVGTLDERYKNLLSSITGARDTSVQNVTTNTSQELGRRGISAESGLFGQTVNKATQPVQQAFAGDISNLGVSQQSALDTLMNMISGNTQNSVEAQRAVQNAIAQLQSGAGQSSVTGALQMQQQQQALSEAQKARDLQLQIAQMGDTKTSNPYFTVSEGGTVIDMRTGKPIYTAPKATTATGGGTNYYKNGSSTDGFVPLSTQLQLQYGGSSKNK